MKTNSGWFKKGCNQDRWKPAIYCMAGCGKRMSRSSSAKRCMPCWRKILDSQFRENNPNWRGGESKCEDCNKLLTYRSAKYSHQCRECYIKSNKKGTNAVNWKGGKWIWLKTLAKRRDNGTCRECGLYEPTIMEADHIKPKSIYPELALELSNIATLCPNCHKRKTNKERMDILNTKTAKGWKRNYKRKLIETYV